MKAIKKKTIIGLVSVNQRFYVVPSVAKSYEECLNNKENHENLILLLFIFSKIRQIQLKKF